MLGQSYKIKKLISKSWIYIFIFIFTCAPFKTTKKPEWVDGRLASYHYRGIATNRSTKEEAIKEARKNAIRNIMEEVGISIESEFERKRSEKGNEIYIEFKDRLRAESKGWLRGVKELNVYTKKSKDIEGYDAWILISIPPGEIERARKQLKEYEKETIKEASCNFDRAEELEKENDFENATIYYNSVLTLLKEINNPESKNLKAKASEKIKRFDNVGVRFMQLTGNTNIIEYAKIIYYYDRTPAPVFLNTADKILLKTNLNREAYVYIINWDRETNEFRLLFPNKYERENLVSPGEMIFPPQKGEEKDDVSFVAEPPMGWNYLKVIASYTLIEIPSFEKEPYLLLSKSDLFEFIFKLSETSYDIEDIQFGIE